MLKIFQYRLFGMLMLFLAVLNGCCNLNQQHTIKRSYTCQEYFKMLQKQGVQIIRTGETYRIIISSDSIFYPNSANLHPDALQILGPLAAYLRCEPPCYDPVADKTPNILPTTPSCYETTYMKIIGYTNDQGSLRRNMALSERQAQRIEKFLSTRGLDVRIMVAVGRGPYEPIADNSIPSHSVENRRIEIRFRKVVVPPLI